MGIKSASTKFMGIRPLRGLCMKGAPHRGAFLTPTSTTKSFSLQALDISLPSKVANTHGDVSACIGRGLYLLKQANISGWVRVSRDVWWTFTTQVVFACGPNDKWKQVWHKHLVSSVLGPFTSLRHYRMCLEWTLRNQTLSTILHRVLVPLVCDSRCAKSRCPNEEVITSHAYYMRETQWVTCAWLTDCLCTLTLTCREMTARAKFVCALWQCDLNCICH